MPPRTSLASASIENLVARGPDGVVDADSHWLRATAAVEARAAREWRYAAYACRARQTTLRVAT